MKNNYGFGKEVTASFDVASILSNDIKNTATNFRAIHKSRIILRFRKYLSSDMFR